jgi:hypothetical protein
MTFPEIADFRRTGCQPGNEKTGWQPVNEKTGWQPVLRLPQVAIFSE